MKSGMLAAESIAEAFKAPSLPDEIKLYSEKFEKSWIREELHKVRNIRPAFKYGLWPGLLYSAIDTYFFRGKAPWTFRIRPITQPCA